MWIRYKDDGNIISQSGEKLEGKNCVEIKEDMIKGELSSNKKDNFFDIEKNIFRKKTKKEIQNDVNKIESENIKKELNDIDLKMMRCTSELILNSEDKDARKVFDNYMKQKKELQDKIKKL